MNLARHYQQHRALGTPSTKDGLPLILNGYTETQRDELTAAGLTPVGTVLYNATAQKFQGYAQGGWVDLH